MSRAEAISRVHQHFHVGEFLVELGRSVAYTTGSASPVLTRILKSLQRSQLR
jgi:hypothetical protein